MPFAVTVTSSAASIGATKRTIREAIALAVRYRESSAGEISIVDLDTNEVFDEVQIKNAQGTFRWLEV